MDKDSQLSIIYWQESELAFSQSFPFSSIIHSAAPCAAFNTNTQLLWLHSSLTADFNNDCISDLFLETSNGQSALILFAILVKDQIKYCQMNMESFDLSNLSGFVTSDFDGDGLMDIAGYNLEWV